MKYEARYVTGHLPSYIPFSWTQILHVDYIVIAGWRGAIIRAGTQQYIGSERGTTLVVLIKALLRVQEGNVFSYMCILKEANIEYLKATTKSPRVAL